MINIDKKEFLKCSIIVAIFIILNVIFINVIGEDYFIYLAKWIDEIVDLGKINSLSVQIGNYTPPYIYFLIIGTYITTNNIFWIKLISTIFTVGISVISYFIIKEFKKDIKLSNALIILLIPSVFINSGLIGQCDSIYTFFVLLFVLLILKNKKRSALFFFGVALAFKLQAIFIAPVFLYLLLKRKIRIIDIIYIPLGFIVTMLPSVIYGRSIFDIIKVELLQSGVYSKFVKSAPNIYSLLHLNYKEIDSLAKILLSFLTIILSIYIVLKNTKDVEYNNNTFLEKVMLLSIMVPYFLPSMHDRYFYMASIFCYIYLIFIDNKAKNKKSNILNVLLIFIATSLPVILYNFVEKINQTTAFVSEWIGVSVISSTIMTYIVMVCFDRYLSGKNITKMLQRK